MKTIRCAREKVPKRFVVKIRALRFRLGAKKDEYQINATTFIQMSDAMYIYIVLNILDETYILNKQGQLGYSLILLNNNFN